MIQLTQAEHDELLAARAERDRLYALINTPELVNFRDAVLLEALHQRERWGTEHDAGKTPADWHWLIAHLAGRALAHANEIAHLDKLSAPGPEVQQMLQRHREKAVHHCVTTAAAVSNWHAAMLGLTNMRPGVDPAGYVCLDKPATAEHHPV